MAKKKPKLPEHLRGKTPEEITEYIMGGIVRGQPKGEAIGDYFAKARSKAAEQARKEREELAAWGETMADQGWVEWEEDEWISPEEFRSRQLAAGRETMTANSSANARALAAFELSDIERLVTRGMPRRKPKPKEQLWTPW